MDEHPIEAQFIGPYAENDELLEKLLVEFLRDHMYWRRNFHPEDPPAISTEAVDDPAYRHSVAAMRRELHRLSAALKRSVPFHSPRYIGHMASDCLLPGLLAQMITLPYNPNNVVQDAAPVTLDMELEAGLMLARMLGFPDDPDAEVCALGHLTSGGSMANYQALVLQRALRLLPPALAAALRAAGLDGPAVGDAPVTAYDDRRLVNLSTPQILELCAAIGPWLEQAMGPDDARRLATTIAEQRVEHLGGCGFREAHPSLGDAVVMVPYTAHYSWQKAMKILGLGTANLMRIPERGMRMDPDALDEALAEAAAEHRPVLAVIGVLGTTEFGTIDPIHRIVDARDRWAERGLGFGIHVDGAWGGYLASMFRAADGSMLPRAQVREGMRYFPSDDVYDAFAALSEVDSVTVDPHKLGYFPFGSGAFVCRDRRMMDLLAQDADYVFDPSSDAASDHDRFRALGRYILEGSKPGAAAAAVCVTHRLLPPHADGFGRLPRQTVRYGEMFYDHLKRTAVELAGEVVLHIPVEPDTNLVCLAVNPAGNRSLTAANAFTRKVFERMRVDPRVPVQTREFFGSFTVMRPDALGAEATTALLDALGLEAEGFDQQGLFVLRHTLMNPWLVDRTNGIDYMALYCEFLTGVLRAEAARD